MEPGTRLEEGIAVSSHDDGVMVGREANPGEKCPPDHSEHRFGATVVYLSRSQVLIAEKSLHVGEPLSDADRKRAEATAAGTPALEDLPAPAKATTAKATTAEKAAAAKAGKAARAKAVKTEKAAAAAAAKAER